MRASHPEQRNGQYQYAANAGFKLPNMVMAVNWELGSASPSGLLDSWVLITCCDVGISGGGRDLLPLGNALLASLKDRGELGGGGGGRSAGKAAEWSREHEREGR